MEFNKSLREKTKQANDVVMKFLPEEEGFPKLLLEAMNYSMRSGGKLLRPLLMQETYRVFGGTDQAVEPFMAAIEMVHTHSLIHDDLPAIDNDDYRRGKKTNHAVYGEALGVLSGDALLNYAYETALKAFDCENSPERVAAALKILARKTGAYGMLGGQSVDVMNEKHHRAEIDRTMLDYIYENKTSALIEASMMIGAVLAGAEERQVEIVELAAKKTGLAFQIQDDILDATGTTEELGKPAGSDAKNEKTTYVTLFGVEGTGREVEAYTREARELVAQIPGEHTFLDQLLLWLAARRK